MEKLLRSENYSTELSLTQIFEMTESWWGYHIEKWCSSSDSILADLASRLRDRRLFKTIRLPSSSEQASSLQRDAIALLESSKLDPEYYFSIIDEADNHRAKTEEPPIVLLDTGEITPVTEVEPLIAQILARKNTSRRWMAVPEAIKIALGVLR